MNLKTAAEILALNTSGQREYAKEIGVKRAAADTKADLAVKLNIRTMEIEKAQRAEREQIAAVKAKATIRTKVETAARKSKTAQVCDVCSKRRPAKDCSGMCRPCYDEGGWENEHSDRSHAAITAEVEDQSGTATLSDADRETYETAMPGCWICHPELNEATAEVRKSTSKVGMVILAKGEATQKSDLVKNAVEKLGGTVKVTYGEESGLTRLVGSIPGGQGSRTVIIVEWYGRAFHYAGSSLNGGKFRNVKELFRDLGL